MNYFLPDWMFAAFAIGGWELCNLAVKKLNWHWCHYVGIGIVVACALILVIRYISRFIHKKKHPEKDNPDAWKSY